MVMGRYLWLLALVAAAVAGLSTEGGCTQLQGSTADCGCPPGLDVDVPFPIDRGEDGPHTPGSYKGLPLRLTPGTAPFLVPGDGVIGVVCIGMSNAAQECGAFITLLGQNWRAEVNPAVRFANCAVGGHAIERWNDPAYDAGLWRRCVSTVLPAAGIRTDQVLLIYHKAAKQFTLGPGGTPLPVYPDPQSDFFAFQRDLTRFAERVLEWFPSVRVVYISSRSSGAFTDNPARGEPLSYEEGHALNQWIERNPEVRGVQYLWGPYLWAPSCAGGITNGSGICYERSDFVADGVHPSMAGRMKIAELMHRRWLRESWYKR